MQVILMEKVVNLGSLGDVVKVKDGFARNYLIPQGKAKRATEANALVHHLELPGLHDIDRPVIGTFVDHLLAGLVRLAGTQAHRFPQLVLREAREEGQAAQGLETRALIGNGVVLANLRKRRG